MILQKSFLEVLVLAMTGMQPEAWLMIQATYNHFHLMNQNMGLLHYATMASLLIQMVSMIVCFRKEQYSNQGATQS